MACYRFPAVLTHEFALTAPGILGTDGQQNRRTGFIAAARYQWCGLYRWLLLSASGHLCHLIRHASCRWTYTMLAFLSFSCYLDFSDKLAKELVMMLSVAVEYLSIVDMNSLALGLLSNITCHST